MDWTDTELAIQRRTGLHLRTARRIWRRLEAEGHDHWTIQAMPWDEAFDAAGDEETQDDKEEAVLRALGLGGTGRAYELWEEAKDRGLIRDDFVSHGSGEVLPRKGSWDIKKRIRQRWPREWWGLDTETLFGWARLLCMTPAENGPSLIGWLPEHDKASMVSILGLCTGTSRLRGACVASWNMRFDAEALLKHMVPWCGVEGLRKLCQEQVLRCDIGKRRYIIKYIPTKVLRFGAVKGDGTTWDCFSLYDMAQFYPGLRLQDAALRYLGLAKVEGVDASRLNEEPGYWDGRETDIERYCLQDARLAAKLGALMAARVKDLWGVDLHAPYSPAQVSQRIFLKDGGRLHPVKHWKAAQCIYDSYYGGRIECRVRGSLDWACIVDMKSAYLWAMVDLPDTEGTWHISKGASPVLHNPEVPYAFVHAVVETDVQEDGWGPLPVRTRSGLLLYPDGRLTGWWPWPEVQHALDLGLIKEPDIVRTVWLLPSQGNDKSPFSYLRNIYKQKETEADPVRRHVIKVCGLGLYGKTAQTMETLMEDETGDYYKTGADGQPKPARVALEPGYLFNPAVASYVTSRVRMALLDKALALGDDAAAVFTDSIVTTKPVDDHSKDLGGWDRKMEEGPCRLLMSGLYQFRGQRPKARGLPIGHDRFDYWSLHGKEARWSKAGPLHLQGAVRREQVDMVNRWCERPKLIHPNADRKRAWRTFRDFEEFFSRAWTGNVVRINQDGLRKAERAMKMMT